MNIPSKPLCPVTWPRINRAGRFRNRIAACVVLVIGFGNGYHAIAQDSKISTLEDRRALVEYLLEKTRQREAWSPIKNEKLGIDPLEEMKEYSTDIINARHETDFYYALAKFSNARHDRHLAVGSRWNSPNNTRDFMRVLAAANVLAADARAPLALEVDFSNSRQPFLFVSRLADNATGLGISIGDRIVAVNGREFPDFVDQARPYFAYSTPENFWTVLARLLPTLSPVLPPEFFGPKLELRLQRSDETKYNVKLDYYVNRALSWPTFDKYPGFRKQLEFESFDVYLPDSGHKVLLLDWYGFRNDLESSIDQLVQTATENGWLDHDLIIDCLRSRGGSRGAYALRHLSPRPFKTTFGNLRLSDAAESFVQRKLRQISDNDFDDAGGSETVDRDQWLRAWLTEDIQPALRRGDEYSGNVPFKCAHLPKNSDGMMQPAETHFRGNMVCWFSPYGGSHLDQFAAMVIDNNLAWTAGMPTGGYSNTWEFTEDVKFPNSGKLAIRFMWTIGQTIRPNGEILEGNPAPVDYFFPMTQENFFDYREQLIDSSLSKFEELKSESDNERN